MHSQKKIGNLYLKHNGKRIAVRDVERSNFFQKIRGLMFRNKENARPLLLFDLKKPKKFKIHSFFVFFSFWVVWADCRGEIQEIKIVKPWNPLIIPDKKFCKLVEIPINDKYSNVTNHLDEVLEKFKKN